MLVIFELFISIGVIFYSIVFVSDLHREYILLITSLNLIIVIPKALLQFVLVSTNRIHENSRSIILERILYGILAVIAILVGIRDYRYLIFIDLFAKIISLILTIYYCKEIVFGKSISLKVGLAEAFDNIKVGISLMFSNIANRSIIGIVRLGIERTWDVTTFAKVSLTLSVSNMLLLFINAVGTVLYPILRKTPNHKLPLIYKTMRNILIISFLGVIIVYYPANQILSLWLPDYADSLKYMALLFPICLYESKMSMLVITYFNTLRKEKLMLKINISILVLSIITTYITIRIFNNLTLTVLLITTLLAVRCVISEIVLSKILNISISFDILIELAMTTIFILFAWFIKGYLGMLLYIFVYFLYVYIKRKEIDELIKLLILLLKNKKKI